MMNEEELLIQVAEAIEYEGKLELNQAIDGIEEWDSLGRMSILSLLDNIGLEVNSEDFSRAKTISDFINSVKF